MRPLLALLLLVLAASALACGGPSARPDPDTFSGTAPATPELCERAVANAEKQESLATGPSPGAPRSTFERGPEDRRRRDRVRRCLAELTERDAACIAMALTSEELRGCERFVALQ